MPQIGIVFLLYDRIHNGVSLPLSKKAKEPLFIQECVGMIAEKKLKNVDRVIKQPKKRGVFSYLFMPAIIPQAKELSRGGFGFLAYLIAYIYQGVRILPRNHPYVNANNIGQYGLRDVITVAANNVKFSKNNIDQIIIFFAVLSGVIIMALQFISFIILLFSGEAFAQTIPEIGLFGTAFPDTDIAFFMLREVFGIPDLFGTLEGGITGFHTGLHFLFNFYNLALLIVAVLVFLYYVIVVVAETASTGTPFGQRFSHIYAPLRLVIAIGLLVPLNYGFNGAQYITLYAAKLGSGFATTGWTVFNDSLDGNPLGAENSTLISPVKSPDINGLVEFMATVNACRAGYATFDGESIEGRVIFTDSNGAVERIPFTYDAYYALSNKNNSDAIVIQFGNYNNETPPKWTPHCGEVTIPINVPMGEGNLGPNGGISFNPGEMGFLQGVYFSFILSLWEDEDLIEIGQNFANYYDRNAIAYEKPQPSFQTEVISEHRTNIENQILAHYIAAASEAEFDIREETRQRGWGGAGIWYNRIAQINGGYTVATLDVPDISAFPIVMENVREQKENADGAFEACKAFNPNLADNNDVDLNGYDMKYAKIMDDSYQYWTCDNTFTTRNFIIDAISAVFGLEGLINIRDTITGPDGEIVQIHPLAKLSALGKGLVESAVSSIGMGVAASGVGGLLSGLGYQAGGQAFIAASSMFVSIGVVGLSIGFITFYILPFLPFIYFFFAVGGWVKGIFEAMVGAPLWALAHLRIDGEGIPGKMAMNGYFLIFEIFLRPILIVFGLIGGMATFSIMATILNEVFDLVVLNTANVNLDGDEAAFSRHTIDVFFFTIMYAIILYMMAMASFKMINMVPNSIIRWLGQSISSFNDNAEDPAGSLTTYAALGGNQIGGKLAGGMTQGAQGIGSLGGGFGRFMGFGNQNPPGG